MHPRRIRDASASINKHVGWKAAKLARAFRVNGTARELRSQPRARKVSVDAKIAFPRSKEHRRVAAEPTQLLSNRDVNTKARALCQSPNETSAVQRFYLLRANERRR